MVWRGLGAWTHVRRSKGRRGGEERITIPRWSCRSHGSTWRRAPQRRPRAGHGIHVGATTSVRISTPSGGRAAVPEVARSVIQAKSSTPTHRGTQSDVAKHIKRRSSASRAAEWHAARRGTVRAEHISGGAPRGVGGRPCHFANHEMDGRGPRQMRAVRRMESLPPRFVSGDAAARSVSSEQRMEDHAIPRPMEVVGGSVCRRYCAAGDSLPGDSAAHCLCLGILQSALMSLFC